MYPEPLLAVQRSFTLFLYKIYPNVIFLMAVTGGRDSDCLRAEQSWVRIPVEERDFLFYIPVQTGPATYTISCTMFTGGRAVGVAMNTHNIQRRCFTRAELQITDDSRATLIPSCCAFVAGFKVNSTLSPFTSTSSNSYEGRDSCQYSDSLRTGRFGDRIPIGAEFSAPVQKGHGNPHNLLCNGYRVSVPRVKRHGRGVKHPHLFGAEVEERVELYICSASRPSWPVLGWSSPLPFIFHFVQTSFVALRSELASPALPG